MFRGFTSKDQFIPVKEPRLNQCYHVAWGKSRGVVGQVMSIDKENKTVAMKAPKTNKPFSLPVKWKDLRHTRKNQLTNPH